MELQKIAEQRICVMLSLNTNITSLIVQKNLAKATRGLNIAIEQLTTGYKLNHAKDNPANYALMRQYEAKLNAWNVAQDNMSIGNNLLETASDSASLIENHIIRIRDLCMQASNGTYSKNSINAIKAEIQGRLDEIDRIRGSTEFNGIKLFGNIDEDGNVEEQNINIQVGIDSSPSSRITIDTSLNIPDLKEFKDIDITNPSTLNKLDNMLSQLSSYQVKIGASQNRIEYALDFAEVNINNLTSSLSTIRDADIAKVSSDFIRYQILQQACATLLATANQMPSLALQLI